jgi:hypothetical protein
VHGVCSAIVPLLHCSVVELLLCCFAHCPLPRLFDCFCVALLQLFSSLTLIFMMKRSISVLFAVIFLNLLS